MEESPQRIAEMCVHVGAENEGADIDKIVDGRLKREDRVPHRVDSDKVVNTEIAPWCLASKLLE